MAASSPWNGPAGEGPREPGGQGQGPREIVMNTAPARDNQGTSKEARGWGKGLQVEPIPSTTGKSQAKTASSVLSAFPGRLPGFPV